METVPEWRFYGEYFDLGRTRVLGFRRDKIGDLKRRLARYFVSPEVDFGQFRMPIRQDYDHEIELTAEQVTVEAGYVASAQVLLAKGMREPLTMGERAQLNGL